MANRTGPKSGEDVVSSLSTLPNIKSVVDREKLCPFLLRMYYRQGMHHRVDEYTPSSTPSPSSELRLYTWKNATLGEITALIRQAIPDLLAQAGSTGQLAFRHIYLDVKKGYFVGRDIGTVRLDNPHASSQAAAVATTSESGQEINPAAPTSTGESAAPAISEERDGKKEQDGPTNKEQQDPSLDPSDPATEAASSPAGDRERGSRAYEKSLASIRFVTGDYLDIAIIAHNVPGFQPPAKPLPRGPGLNTDEREQGRERGSRGGGAGGGGGPIRRGGWSGRSGPTGDRFSGRLGALSGAGGGGGGRNGHGQGHPTQRRSRGLDPQNEPSWKGRGRGR